MPSNCQGCNMRGQTRHGRYTEVIEQALRQHLKLPLRSERHKNYLQLFVDNRQLEILDNLDWQLIYGRRGTGKTLLLGVLSADEAVRLIHARDPARPMLLYVSFNAPHLPNEAPPEAVAG